MTFIAAPSNVPLPFPFSKFLTFRTSLHFPFSFALIFRHHASRLVEPYPRVGTQNPQAEASCAKPKLFLYGY